MTAGGGGLPSRLKWTVAPPACATGAEALCLTGGRFLVDVAWRLPDGRSGMGQARKVYVNPSGHLASAADTAAF